MTDASFPFPAAASLKPWRVALSTALILGVLALVEPTQARASFAFTIEALLGIAPFLLASIAIASAAIASGADAIIARAFTGRPARMIVMAALLGALSPFCSCGVIPIIAALLAMGAPLAPVMAFWLASPLMDPEMFVLTLGVLGWEFAVAKTLAAIGLGLMGGTVVHQLTPWIGEALRDGIGGGCSPTATVRGTKPIVWAFWQDATRRAKFGRETAKGLRFLGQWMTLAFVLESLMLAYIPAETVTSFLGGAGIGPIVIATLVGVPAYLNGFAALPLVGGLIDHGMAPGAGMAFLIAGGVTSLPAAMAVWALVRPRVFALYLALSMVGAFLAGVVFQVWMAI
ncbi:permease [Tabrizicola sp.]|uniref:permease n=1 Tax=Tabrizicola sp. TaxID=2005166 RepID=UPI00286A3A20|nr:permease [Tabrizicola sp.]